MTRLVCVMINILPTDRYLESTEIGGDKVKEQGASDFTGALEQTQTLPQQHSGKKQMKKKIFESVVRKPSAAAQRMWNLWEQSRVE